MSLETQAPGAAGAKPNFCMRCGAPAAAAGPFCIHCGSPFDGPPPQPEPPPQPAYQPTAWTGFSSCGHCGGDGHGLAADEVYCPTCRWLRPLAQDYSLPVDVYLWALDAQAMNTLNGIGPLNAAARGLSGKIGRPWLEASVNGIRLGPDQAPVIFDEAVRAARIIGLPRLPEIYVSGDQMWDALTLGDEHSAFVVLGSVLTNFRGEDLRYVLGREMGHVAAGHALWKTVSHMLSGKQQNRSIGNEGLMQFLNPAKLVESAIDAPLMAWARHAEITADRAGALVVGREEIARRVCIQWSLKSFPLYAMLNHEALDRQIAESENQTVQAAEWTMSSTPFLARRLKLLREFMQGEMFQAYRARIDYWTAELPARPDASGPPPAPAAPAPVDPSVAGAESATPPGGEVRLTCTACGGAMRIPKTDLEGKNEVKVRCPNEKCGKVLILTPAPPPRDHPSAPAPEPEPAPVRKPKTTLRIVCVACDKAMNVEKKDLVGEGDALVRCPNPDCGKVLTLKRRPSTTPPSPPPAADQLAGD